MRYREVLIDIDHDGEDPRKAVEESKVWAVKVRDALLGFGVDKVNVYFSGSKGFGLGFSSSTFWPHDDAGELRYVPHGNEILKRFIFLLMDEVGFPKAKSAIVGWDPMVYSKKSPVRIPGMPHKKSVEKFGKVLYRTLLPDQFGSMSLDQILDYASQPRKSKELPDQAPIPHLVDLWDQAVVASFKVAPGSTKGKSSKKKSNGKGKKGRAIGSVEYESFGKGKVQDALKSLRDEGTNPYPPCIASIRADALKGKTGIRNQVGVAVCSFHLTAGEGFSEVMDTMTHVPTQDDIRVATQGQWDSISRNPGYYDFGPRGCGVFRSVGCRCDHTCPLHAELSDTLNPKVIPATRQAYDWEDVSFVTLDEARKALKDNLENSTEDLLHADQPGVGKSTVAGQVGVEKSKVHPVVFACQTREQLKQLKKRLGGDIEIKDPRTSDNCMKVGWAGVVGSQGWNVTTHVCMSCDAFNMADKTASQCGYWEQWASDHPYWGVTHAHLMSGLPQECRQATLYVIDEDPMQACLRWAGGGMFDKNDLVGLAARLPWEHQGGIMEFQMGDEPVSDADKLLMAVAQGLYRLELGRVPKDQVPEEGQQVGPDAVLLPLLDDTGKLTDETRDLIKKVANQLENKTLPKPSLRAVEGGDVPPRNVLVDLIRALDVGLKSRERQEQGQTPVAVPVKVERVAGDDGEVAGKAGNIEPGSQWQMGVQRFDSIKIPKSVKVASDQDDEDDVEVPTRVVVMDATAQATLLELATGRKLKHIRQHVEPVGEWIQITDARVPKATLLHDDAAIKRWVERVIDLINRCRQQHGGTLVVGPLAFNKFLKSELSRKVMWKGVRVEHFYGIRGLSLEDFDACIIVGFPQPPRDSVYLAASAVLEGEELDETYERVWMPYRDVGGPDKDGKWLGSEVEMPRDERLRSIWISQTMAEVYQAAYRIRGLQRKVPTYILTSVPMLPEYRLPVKLMSGRELWSAGAKGRTISNNVERVLWSLYDRFGWVSLHFLEAVFGHDPDLYGPCKLAGGVDQLLGKQPWIKILKKAGVFPQIAPRRIREAWEGLMVEEMITTIEVSLKVNGQTGRPLRDQLFGNPDQWLEQHVEFFKGVGVVPSFDGSPDMTNRSEENGKN